MKPTLNRAFKASQQYLSRTTQPSPPFSTSLPSFPKRSTHKHLYTSSQRHFFNFSRNSINPRDRDTRALPPDRHFIPFLKTKKDHFDFFHSHLNKILLTPMPILEGKGPLLRRFIPSQNNNVVMISHSQRHLSRIKKFALIRLRDTGVYPVRTMWPWYFEHTLRQSPAAKTYGLLRMSLSDSPILQFNNLLSVALVVYIIQDIIFEYFYILRPSLDSIIHDQLFEQTYRQAAYSFVKDSPIAQMGTGAHWDLYGFRYIFARNFQLYKWGTNSRHYDKFIQFYLDKEHDIQTHLLMSFYRTPVTESTRYILQDRIESHRMPREATEARQAHSEISTFLHPGKFTIADIMSPGAAETDRYFNLIQSKINAITPGSYKGVLFREALNLVILRNCFETWIQHTNKKTPPTSLPYQFRHIPKASYENVVQFSSKRTDDDVLREIQTIFSQTPLADLKNITSVDVGAAIANNVPSPLFALEFASVYANTKSLLQDTLPPQDLKPASTDHPSPATLAATQMLIPQDLLQRYPYSANHTSQSLCQSLLLIDLSIGQILTELHRISPNTFANQQQQQQYQQVQSLNLSPPQMYTAPQFQSVPGQIQQQQQYVAPPQQQQHQYVPSQQQQQPPQQQPQQQPQLHEQAYQQMSNPAATSTLDNNSGQQPHQTQQQQHPQHLQQQMYQYPQPMYQQPNYSSHPQQPLHVANQLQFAPHYQQNYVPQQQQYYQPPQQQQQQYYQQPQQYFSPPQQQQQQPQSLTHEQQPPQPPLLTHQQQQINFMANIPPYQLGSDIASPVNTFLLTPTPTTASPPPPQETKDTTE